MHPISSSTVNIDQSLIDQHNDTSIKRIEKLIEEGWEVYVFIGCLPHEAMPKYEGGSLIDAQRSANEEIPGFLPSEAKGIWVSLDAASSVDLSKINPNRIHLVMSCNDPVRMAKLKGLFLKAVVDQSTTKGFGEGILDRLWSILRIDPRSTLIIESAFDVHTRAVEGLTQMRFNHVYLEYPKQDDIDHENGPKQIYNEYLQQIGGIEHLEQSKKYEEFIEASCPNERMRNSFFRLNPTLEKRIPNFTYYLARQAKYFENHPHPITSYIKQARQMTVDHLKTLSQRATFYENSLYPYPTNFRTRGRDCFFVAQGKQN